MHNLTLEQIANIVGGECVGDSSAKITGIAPLNSASNGELTFLFDPRYKTFLPETKAECVLLTRDHLDACPVNSIVVANPYVAYAKVSQQFENLPKSMVGVHQSAVVADDVVIDDTVSIGPNSVIYPGVTLGKNVVIGANCTIRENVEIGSDCYLHDNISIYHHVALKSRVKIHSGVVIGADGFGIAKENGVWHKIAQLGTVIIHDDVEIGANTSIDRGAISDTIISKGVKLDNQIQIGHNVFIGENTAVAGCAGIAGSTKIGKDCLIGGGVGIAGHNTITDNVTLTAFAGARGDITKPGVYSSNVGCIEDSKWRKLEARLRNLDGYVKRLLKLEKSIEGKRNDENS